MSTPAEFRPRPAWLANHEFAAGLDAAMKPRDPADHDDPSQLARKEAELQLAEEIGNPELIAAKRLEYGIAQAQHDHEGDPR
ncbi:hypothetical protein SAMN05216184_108137 [Georgenia satyanarayanai]|uniref:Uncharacterized protein n=1 Tax=Georgenia satyanarayanai TaxID=860221 RepID=A0A2Y9C6P4_9MICO|nr:hypothetical protein [Georgenia satyanarayanai]PYF99255.1 hypothetical protein A8987_108137 [Georgenia satyanarayanai]SSA43373.1 hypothetical protein SAMN05216184_108137 [Georgenia satyanarayanai]